MFSQSVIEEIGCYVYLLRDPRSSEVFYIGKGVGNRVFNHLSCALERPEESDKLNRIRDIQESGLELEHFIVRHGLSEEAAFEVEASLIDFVGMSNLTNIQSGHYSSDYGIKTASEVAAMYEAEIFEIDQPALLINLNRYYRRDLTAQELYDVTRMSWVVSKQRRDKVVYAIATYKGLTREVYSVDRWFHDANVGENRWGFEGRIAPSDIRQKYLYKSIRHLVKKGQANPIRYMNC